jgi:hypothetical protein
MIFTNLFEIPLDVIIKAIIVHGILITVFIYMTFKIKKRGGKYAKRYLGAFYFTTAMGLVLNFIFIFIHDPFIVELLYYFTLYFLFLGTYFLLIFTLIIYKSEKIITKKKQILLLVILSIITWGMIFVPNGLVINESTDWYPQYSLTFFLYLIIVLSFGSVGPILYISVKIYYKFELIDLKRRWAFFFWGLIFLFTFAFGTLFSHFFPLTNLRSLWSIVSLFLVVTASILIYCGVVKKPT